MSARFLIELDKIQFGDIRPENWDLPNAKLDHRPENKPQGREA
jgi:hypothetical protein